MIKQRFRNPTLSYDIGNKVLMLFNGKSTDGNAPDVGISIEEGSRRSSIFFNQENFKTLEKDMREFKEIKDSWRGTNKRIYNGNRGSRMLATYRQAQFINATITIMGKRSLSVNMDYKCLKWMLESFEALRDLTEAEAMNHG
jgi:hypothetical protein